VLNHDADWINKVYIEISKQKFNDMQLQMSMHGVNKKDLDRMRRQFERDIGIEKKEIFSIPSIADFNRLGISTGSPTGTTFIRGKKKK